MDRMIYTAASGAARILEQQAVIGHNLANINTTGFREQMAIYRSVPVTGTGTIPTRVSTAMTTPGSSLLEGSLSETGKALDAAISGSGWFSVQTASGEGYTRAGEFSVNDQGMLVTREGWPVLSEDGAPVVVPEHSAIVLSESGSLSVRSPGPGPVEIQPVAQLKLVNPSFMDIVRGDDGVFRLADGNAAGHDARVRIVPGFLEKSNVNAASALIGMISNARHFEMQMKAIQNADSNAERANTILSVT